MREIQIMSISQTHGHVQCSYRVSPELSKFFSAQEMFIEYTSSVESVPKSILIIPFVANVLPIIWLSDSILWVEELDRTFYESLLRIKSAFQDLYPRAKLLGRVVPAQLVDNSYVVNREALLLFSGGVDAHVSYLRLQHFNPLLLNIQGWYQSKPNLRQEHVAEVDRRDISSFCESQKKDFEFVKSNFATCINSKIFDKCYHKLLGDSLWHGFQHAMNFITIAMPVAYLKGIRNIYIASSFSLGHVGQCASYPTTDNEYRFAGVGRCVHDAFELSRQDKVHYLVNYQRASGKQYPVRVCSFNDKNCCECDKCFRTILEIVAENGNVRDFGFEINGNLKNHFSALMDRKIIQFGIQGESLKHWPDIICRMKENYNNIDDKSFVDWFLNYDFAGARKRAVRNYYIKNFFQIVKRKILHNGVQD